MADEIRLVTFEGENVAPINDALMWDVAIGDSGVIYGCETTLKNASTLHIEAGYGVICGRHFQIFESDVPVTLSPGGDLLGRLYIHMDLSDASEPVQLLVETDASLTPEEQDANINIINGIWDMNLATFALNAVTISNLQNVFSTVAGGGSNLIAGTETGATASQAYVKGQYIIWGGRLWEVTAAIAQGDQFVIGSNLSATSTTVGNELTELNSSLNNIDVRYTTEHGAEWSPRGAGTWSPFSSGPSLDYGIEITSTAQQTSFKNGQYVMWLDGYNVDMDTFAQSFSGGIRLIKKLNPSPVHSTGYTALSDHIGLVEITGPFAIANISIYANPALFKIKDGHTVSDAIYYGNSGTGTFNTELGKKYITFSIGNATNGGQITGGDMLYSLMLNKKGYTSNAPTTICFEATENSVTFVYGSSNTLIVCPID